ncbi:DUF3833 domain-containing protein [Vibrio sp. SCSIO 43136]|uniref:DUF3833 domain-containing protein n=1 Tax=Vibrio sp. SCSIO 43136 TaxID=2819101 RepID=UPI0020765BD9|nr:DUF3833 domain-containing protein [Vibrio sp. SCSIO 43136]USD64364.1 DUF3833 domain-containing protein [Vibrio sp. SCSIO 43136]
MKKWVLTFLSLFLSACSADISDYDQSKPEFDLFGFFQGESKAWGMIQDYSGKVQRSFEVTLIGRVEQDTLILEEDFVFNDGEKDTRVWRIERNAYGKYVGRADDIIGVANGEESGNALRWRYDFSLKLEDSVIEVHFDDWLYRLDERRVVNRTSIRKFGIEVAELTIFFERSAD